MGVPAIPVPNSARVTIKGTLLGKPVSLNLWAQTTSGSVDDTKLATLALRVAVLQLVSFRGALSADYTSTVVEAQDYSTGPGSIQSSTFGNGHGFGGPSEPSLIALRLFADTTPPRSSHRSTVWVHSIPQERVIEDEIEHGYADGLAAGWSNLIVILPIFGWRYVAASLIDRGAPRSAGVVAPITSVSVASYQVAPRRGRMRP